jgi:hypothetical protein
MEEALCLQQKMELPGGARKSAPVADIAVMGRKPQRAWDWADDIGATGNRAAEDR